MTETEITPPPLHPGALAVPIASIKVGPRIRQDFGDIDALAASIAELGLLHPIVIDKHHKLLAGERRLRAAQKLGWTTIPVTIART
jgi:ParB family chromosome partitioning protein